MTSHAFAHETYGSTDVIFVFLSLDVSTPFMYTAPEHRGMTANRNIYFDTAVFIGATSMGVPDFCGYEPAMFWSQISRPANCCQMLRF